MSVLLPIGLALGAAGTGVSMAASAAAASASEDAIKAGIQRQQQFQKQATPVVDASIQASSAPSVFEQVRQGKMKAGDLFKKIQAMPLSASMSPITTDPQSKARIAAQVAQGNEAGAGLAGFQEAMSQQSLKDQEVKRQLGVISNLSSADAGTTEALTKLGAMSGADLAGIGSMFSTVGNLGALYGVMQPKVNYRG